MRQLGIWAALGIWAGLCLGGALYATWQGYGGRAFGAMLTVFAFFLLVMLAFAARGVAEKWAVKFGPGGGFFLGACVFVFYLVYLLGAGTFAVARVGMALEAEGVGGARRRDGRPDLRAAGIGRVCGRSGAGSVAGLCDAGGHLGVREVR